MTPAKLIDLKL